MMSGAREARGRKAEAVNNASATARSHQIMRVAVPLLALLLLTVPLIAHHGTGGIYDMSKSVTLKGTVTMFKFVNPHVLVYLDVQGKAGTVNWTAEGPPVINWTRTGWNRNSIKAGDQVTVTLYPAKNGKPEGVLAKMVTANGKEWCCETK